MSLYGPLWDCQGLSIKNATDVVNNMVQKMVALTGLSGAGKSTLAANASARLGYQVISINSIVSTLAARRGFRQRTPYVIYNVATNGLTGHNESVLSEVLKEAARATSPVIVDSIYDFRLAMQIAERIGRENLTIISMDTGLMERVRRRNGRIISFKFLKDVPKFLSGVGLVMSHADFSISRGSPEEAFSELESILAAQARR